jgi:hypothetical protein
MPASMYGKLVSLLLEEEGRLGKRIHTSANNLHGSGHRHLYYTCMAVDSDIDTTSGNDISSSSPMKCKVDHSPMSRRRPHGRRGCFHVELRTMESRSSRRTGAARAVRAADEPHTAAVLCTGAGSARLGAPPAAVFDCLGSRRCCPPPKGLPASERQHPPANKVSGCFTHAVHPPTTYTATRRPPTPPWV